MIVRSRDLSFLDCRLVMTSGGPPAAGQILRFRRSAPKAPAMLPACLAMEFPDIPPEGVIRDVAARLSDHDSGMVVAYSYER